MNKVQLKKKGPEPQLEKRFLAQSTDNLRSIKIAPLELDDSPAEKSALPAINTKRGSQTDVVELKKTKSASKNAVLDKDLINVLQSLDDKYFVGTKSSYKVFKEFDVDGDGKIYSFGLGKNQFFHHRFCVTSRFCSKIRKCKPCQKTRHPENLGIFGSSAKGIR